jgi:hypothetical protein
MDCGFPAWRPALPFQDFVAVLLNCVVLHAEKPLSSRGFGFVSGLLRHFGGMAQSWSI